MSGFASRRRGTRRSRNGADRAYLSWKAAEQGIWARFIELAGEINTQMPKFVISRVATVLNDDGKALNGSRMLVLGL